MLNIIICEDSESQRKQLEDRIRRVITDNMLNIGIGMSTRNPEDVIDYVSKKEKWTGIYFLDIDLGSSIDGLKLASKIREYDVSGYIVFITAYTHMAHLTFQYKVEAMDYIVKDMQGNIEGRLEECILKAVNNYKITSANLERNNNFFYVETLDRTIRLNYDEIMFFETIKTNRKIRIHAKTKHIEFFSRINKLEEELKDGFYRCHRGYLVNIKNIKEVDKKEELIYMLNGEQCPYSRRMLKGLLDIWKK